MRDLHLWRLLQRPTLDAAELTPLLVELAGLSLAERTPFLGALVPALAHPDAGLRRAAVAALAGASGRPGLQRIVAAMSDPDGEVRAEAVEALRGCLVGGDWPRWAHALFHPDGDVRRLAIDPDRPFPPPTSYQLYLLNDPVCGPAVLAQLRQRPLDGSSLPLVFHLTRNGVITAETARALCAAVPWNDWLSFLGDLVPRDAEMTSSLDEAMQPAWLDNLFGHYVPDQLDEMLLLFWDDPPGDGDLSPHGRFFRQLWQACLDESVFFRHWLAFTLLGIAAQRQSWPPLAARICALCYPPFLNCPWVPIATRRSAVWALRDAADRCSRLPAEQIRPIALSEVCRTGPSGPLDLVALAAVLNALDGDPLAHLLDWSDEGAVAAAFDADPEGGLALLALPTASAWQRRRFIRAFCGRRGPALFRELARIAQAVPADGLDVLDGLDGPAACQVLEQLLDLEGTPGRRGFSENKIQRLAARLAVPIAAGQVARFVRLWLARPAPDESALASAVLTRLIHDHDSRLVVPAVVGLEPPLLQSFLNLLPFCAGFPYDTEIGLADRLVGHDDPAVRAWAVARLRDHKAILAARARAEAEAEAADLTAAPVLRLGACAGLAARPDPVEPDVEACLALLASHDPAAEVAGQLGRFLTDDDDFLLALDVAMVRHWRGERRLPPLGHAWLYRWDEHRAALAKLLVTDDLPKPLAGKGIAGAVAWAASLPSRVLGRRLLEAAAAVLEQWRWHDVERLHRAWDGPLVEALARAACTPLADLVARFCHHGVRHLADAAARASLDALRRRLLVLMPDVPDDARELFAPWIDARGLTAAAPSAAVEAPPTEADATTDDDTLARRVLVNDDAAAARALLQRPGGPARLAEGLSATPSARWPLTLLDALAGVGGPLRSALRRLAGDRAARPEVRFRVATALWPDGGDGVFADALDAACAPAPEDWLTAEDHAWLCAWNPGPERDLFLRLIRAPHTRAQGSAIDVLARASDDDPRIHEAFLDFLEAWQGRMREWRLTAARWLFGHGERCSVVPILLGESPGTEPAYPALLAGVPAGVVAAVTAGVLMAGQGEAAEACLLGMLEHGRAFAGTWSTPGHRLPGGAAPGRVDPLARDEALAQLLAGATSTAVRGRARRALRGGMGRSDKLRRVAETFAWGVRVGRQLTGRLFTLEMIAGEDLGYTRLRENKLFISPLPLLRGQQNGREVVRGLILHEFGHHLFHKGDGAEAVWEQAQQENLGRLLNLVSDEHLERNLRSRDEGFGNQLKQLAAFAFQHTAREVAVTALLDGLRGKAFEVLTAAHLAVARRPGCVLVNSGRALLQMERAGMSFARFVRALRMGKGNRHADPKVARGLDLFRGDFRKLDMAGLMGVTRKLREIFGEETDLLEAFNPEGALLGDADELADASEGITNEELQSAIRRALEGRVTSTSHTRGGGAGGRAYNVGPDEAFDPITNVVPRLHDRARHAAYADRVARPARQMRQFLERLGLGVVAQRLRTRGKAFDRSRVRPLVLRGDPRVLIAREMRPLTDLFLGVLLDCSGSMSADNNIEKAKLFATLLAEAARGLRGVTLRLWGFTDCTLYDCGDAARPAVHDLEPEDANNDSAALWHAAQAARASNRRARVLVMISDGSPAGCSVASLQALVRRLTTRQKMLCAQVAVRPLDDVCFPEYVLLENDNIDECVRRFGAVAMRLVRQALKG